MTKRGIIGLGAFAKESNETGIGILTVVYGRKRERAEG